MTPARVAIVTGAAQGIGAAVATRLAADGFDVAVIDLDAATCASTVVAVEQCGQRAIAIGADVADEGAVAAAMAKITAELGTPLVLVSNAGVLRDALLGKMSVADWDTVMAVNLRGSFLMARAVEAGMRAAKWGRIVNLASTAAVGDIGRGNYAAAKAGLIGFTKTLALELGRFNVTVNAVAPGFTVTEMTRRVAERVGVPFDEMVAEAVSHIAVRRAGDPSDIANAISFFVDERAGFVSGQVLYVAGGPIG